MTECVWCRRTDTERVPVNATIGGRAERCVDADDCMAAKQRAARARAAWARGFQQ